MISSLNSIVAAFIMVPSVGETAPCLCASSSQAEIGGQVALAIIGILYGVYKLRYEDMWNSSKNVEG